VAPIVLESTPASDQLSDATRRAFQDLIATLAARLTEKGLPHERAVQLATNVWTSVEGALILSRVLHNPEPFDLAIAQLAATADNEATAPTHHTRKGT
jgi:hypothetical protein